MGGDIILRSRLREPTGSRPGVDWPPDGSDGRHIQTRASARTSSGMLALPLLVTPGDAVRSAPNRRRSQRGDGRLGPISAPAGRLRYRNGAHLVPHELHVCNQTVPGHLHRNS